MKACACEQSQYRETVRDRGAHSRGSSAVLENTAKSPRKILRGKTPPASLRNRRLFVPDHREFNQ